ncbi:MULTISPECIES: SRPBCC domain-containing protein [Aeromicrobium]|uniref:SRPBCC domain-containing protein n=1 Tax=Aeromicrobium TaxID=2040 RepID=UPI00257D6B8E|nr:MULTISPECIES: SRPBCC domain-containing protein [Aeromicrobium]
MNPTFDRALDLSLERIIRTSPQVVWDAWTDPARLQQWWLPAPSLCRVEHLDVRPSGGFVTRMSEDGGASWVPHMNACFLAVDAGERLVFTNTVDSTWRPAAPAPVHMTATVTFDDHPEGTAYLVVVRHGDPAARDLHADLGFHEGWGSVTDQLTALAEAVTA